jgi:uncharacterized membrane protein
MSKIEIKRHIAKTITWRVVGTIDTIILSWILTGNLKIGMAIGGLEVLTKSLLYFLHERVWYKWVKFGIVKDQPKKKEKKEYKPTKVKVESTEPKIKRLTYSKRTD